MSLITINTNGDKKPKEFSKQILVTAWISGSIIIAFACWLTYMMVIHGHSGDVQLIAIILTGGFAEITAGTSFYYYKSKRENEIKLMALYGRNYSESESDSDNI